MIINDGFRHRSKRREKCGQPRRRLRKNLQMFIKLQRNHLFLQNDLLFCHTTESHNLGLCLHSREARRSKLADGNSQTRVKHFSTIALGLS